MAGTLSRAREGNLRGPERPQPLPAFEAPATTLTKMMTHEYNIRHPKKNRDITGIFMLFTKAHDLFT